MMLTPLLGAIAGIATKDLVIAGLAGISAALGAKTLFRRDEAVEDRRRNAIKMAAELKTMGLGRFSPILEDFAVGDLSSMVHRVRAFRDMLASDEDRLAFVDDVFAKQLLPRLRDPQRGQAIIQAVDEFRQGVSASSKEQAS